MRRRPHRPAPTPKPTTDRSSSRWADWAPAAIVFTTARIGAATPFPVPSSPFPVPNDSLSPLFQAVIEATEEAIVNSLLRAETVRGFRGTVAALPIDSTTAILRRFGAIRP